MNHATTVRIGLVLIAFMVTSLLQAPTAPGQSSIGWRSDGSGRYPTADPPVRWSQEENIVWQTSLPGRGYGSPIVVGDRVFVVSEPAELLCMRCSDGEILWQRSQTSVALLGAELAGQAEREYAALNKQKSLLRRQQQELRRKDPPAQEQLDDVAARIVALDDKIATITAGYPPPIRSGGSGNAAATPVSDGKRVFTVFGTGIVAAYTVDGKRLWMKYVEAPNIGFGHSSSPVLAGGRLIVHVNDLIALDPSSGDEAWRLKLRPAHATPVTTDLDGEDVLIVPCGAAVRARDGTVLAEGTFSLSECSAILVDRTVFAYEGGRIRALTLSHLSTGLLELQSAWEGSVASGRRTPSGVCHDGLLYAVNTAGILDVTDATTGESVYRRRLEVGNVFSSVTAPGRLLYVCSTKGTTVILRPGRQYREIARNTLEGTGSSPVFVGNRLYMRGSKHLYCISDGRPTAGAGG